MTNDAAQQVLSSIDTQEMTSLAEQLVRIQSFKTEETEIAHFLATYLSDRGYEVLQQEVEPGRFQTIATLRGTGGGKSFMLNGHTDIDPLAMGWKRDPWSPSVEDDRIYGAGIRNMKAGIASMITAAEALRTSGVERRGDIVVACVVGELQGGVGTIYLCENGPLADMAVIPEPHGANNVLTTHAGVVEFAVHIIGNSRHIVRKDEAVDALANMAKAIPALNGVQFTHTPREDLPGLPRINVGAVIGGRGRDYDLRGPNWVSDFCTALVDVRFLPGMSSESVRADIERVLDAIKPEDPNFQYEIEMPPDPKHRVFTRVMEPFDLPKDEYIVDAVLRSFRAVTGREPEGFGTVLPGSYTGDDTTHLWRAGVPCLLYGPAGASESETVPDEYVRIPDMEQVARVLALTALDVISLPS